MKFQDQGLIPGAIQLSLFHYPLKVKNKETLSKRALLKPNTVDFMLSPPYPPLNFFRLKKAVRGLSIHFLGSSEFG